LPIENFEADIVSSHCPARVDDLLKSAGRSARHSSAEFSLLLSCCSERHPWSKIPVQPRLNWELVFKLGEHHRVLPALFRSLSGRDDVPDSIQSALRARFQNHSLRVLRFSAELVRVVHHFSEAGIPVLAHKGPLLGHMLYSDPAMRQFGDLDLLVAPEDVSKARAALQQLGYEPQLKLTPRQDKAYLLTGYESVFGLGSETNLLELQWRIVPRFYAIDFDMRALFARSVEVRFEGFPIRTLGREDLMLALCVHAAKHQSAHLGMHRDIATLAQQELDWQWISTEAERLGIRRILALSLSLACDLIHCNSPYSLNADSNRNVQRIAADAESRLQNGAEIDPESIQYFLAMIKLRERWRHRATFLWRLATTPGVGEWEAVQLPDRFFSLYRAVRLLRLAKRFIGSQPALGPGPQPTPSTLTV
jgi:hypothetical protein